jgi:hypothetical protein
VPTRNSRAANLCRKEEISIPPVALILVRHATNPAVRELYLVGARL